MIYLLLFLVSFVAMVLGSMSSYSVVRMVCVYGGFLNLVILTIKLLAYAIN